jgi:uncharacterized protein YjeT (DUF2065 family)
MTALQWIGLIVGLVIVATRLPMVIWPGPMGDRILGLIARRGFVRSFSVVPLVVAFAIARTTTQPLSLFEYVLLVLAVLWVLGGLTWLVFPQAVRSIAEQLFKKEAFVRYSGAAAVVFGCWLTYLSLNA